MTSKVVAFDRRSRAAPARQARAAARPPIPTRECERCRAGSRVLDVVETAVWLRRRRRCLVCGWRWTTRERRGEESPTLARLARNCAGWSNGGRWRSMPSSGSSTTY